MKFKATILSLLMAFSTSVVAEFERVTMEQVKAAQTMIQLNGYTCDTVDQMQPFILGGGFNVYCNNWRYSYELEDKGGRWIVTVD